MARLGADRTAHLERMPLAEDAAAGRDRNGPPPTASSGCDRASEQPVAYCLGLCGGGRRCIVIMASMIAPAIMP